MPRPVTRERRPPSAGRAPTRTARTSRRRRRRGREEEGRGRPRRGRRARARPDRVGAALLLQPRGRRAGPGLLPGQAAGHRACWSRRATGSARARSCCDSRTTSSAAPWPRSKSQLDKAAARVRAPEAALRAGADQRAGIQRRDLRAGAAADLAARTPSASWATPRSAPRSPAPSPQRLVNLGDQVQIGQHLFDIVDFDSIVARVYVPEKHLGELRRGLPARLSGRRPPAAASTRAAVERIAPIVDPSDRHGQGHDRRRRPARVCVPGMYVDVDLVTATHAGRRAGAQAGPGLRQRPDLRLPR